MKQKPSPATAAAIVSAICAVICVVATFRTCHLASHSNVIAALQTRPYLSLDVTSQGGKFLRAENRDGNVKLLVTYRIKNFGSTPARNIEIADNVEMGKMPDGNPLLTPLRKPGPVSIAAGEEYIATLEMHHKGGGEFSDFVQKVESGVITARFDFFLKYTGMPPEDREYFTGLSCHVFSHGVQILASSIR